MAGTKALALVGIVLAGCGGGSLQGDAKAVTGLRIGWLSYTDDGTLLVASRERVVRLDGGLNEIDRTIPPFPFDPSVTPPGLQFFGLSHDGHIATMSWQSDASLPDDVATVDGGAIVFTIPAADLLRVDHESPIATVFEGQSLSPDGKTTATVEQPDMLVTAVDGGAILWQAQKLFVHPPVFTPDGGALIVGGDQSTLEVVRVGDGAHLMTLSPPGFGAYMSVAVSADSATLATVSGDGVTSVVTSWRLSDGALLATAALPADLGGFPVAVALSPDGDRVAVSFVPGGFDALVVFAGDRLLYRRDGETDFALAFSPDGRTLAAASAKRGVQLLDASDGTLIRERVLPVGAN